MMRRFLSFAVASTMFLGGLGSAYILFFEATLAPLKFLAGAGATATVGGFWLWEDFLAPVLRRESGA
jgi:hypothetical protein